MIEKNLTKRMLCITCKHPVEVKKIVAECHKEIIVALKCGHERHLRLGTPEDKHIWDMHQRRK